MGRTLVCNMLVMRVFPDRQCSVVNWEYSKSRDSYDRVKYVHPHRRADTGVESKE